MEQFKIFRNTISQTTEEFLVERTAIRSMSRTGNHTNKLLGNFSREIGLGKLISLAERVEISTNDFIYQAGEKMDFIYFPETLVVSEFQILEDGRTMEIALIGNEGMIGSFPFTAGGAAISWTQALIGGAAFKIDLQTLAREMDKNGNFQKFFYGYLENYVKQISQRAVCVCFHSAEARLCGWFLMIHDRLRGNKFPMTHEQISRSIGVHRPTVSRTAELLRIKGIIDYGRGEIQILNRGKLEETACECYQQIHSGSAAEKFL